MQWIDCEKNYYIFFLRIIDINDWFNVCRTISYYNVRHIKYNIYEAKAKWNYFRLVTLKMVHPNDREFPSYDITGTLDKQYVLAGISLQDWIRQHILVIGHRLNLGLISILRYFCNKYFIYFLMFFCFIYFYLVKISFRWDVWNYSILGIIKEAGRWISYG